MSTASAIQFNNTELLIKYIRTCNYMGTHTMQEGHRVYVNYEYPRNVHHTYLEYYTTQQEANQRIEEINNTIKSYNESLKND